jgi:hypothetical protein
VINRFTLAGLLAVVSIAALVVLGVVVLGDNDAPAARSEARAADTSTPDPSAGTPTPAGSSTAVPPKRRTKDLAKAARAAGCQVIRARDEGNEHVDRNVTAADYGTNPPTSGVHAPEWASDGIYRPGNTPTLGTLVHTLEHGRINIQYAPGTDADTIAKLTGLFEELDKGHHLLLYENGTGMPFAVAATAWNHMLGCPEVNDRIYDAIRAFTARFVDQGPEVVP